MRLDLGSALKVVRGGADEQGGPVSATMLVATLIFATLVALWGSPAVLTAARSFTERLRGDVEVGEPVDVEAIPTLDAAFEPPPPRKRAAA